VFDLANQELSHPEGMIDVKLDAYIQKIFLGLLI